MTERAPSDVQHVPPEIAELAEDFEILGEVGRGSTAVVYKARELELDRIVAIKVIRARHLADDEAVRRLEREARLVARFDHPNVVSLHAVRRLRHDSLALVMRYVHGETLREELRRRGPLPAARVRRLAADVARALAAAHAYGVVHRDVKPENVHIEHPSGRALLADFGAAAPLDAAFRLTATGMTIGTPGYLAPELVDGADATPSSDIYGLGLVAWEALTGVQPWAGDTLFEVLAFRKHGALPPLASVVADVPDGLAVAIERALRPDPADRWPDASAMLTAIAAPETPRRGGLRARLSGLGMGPAPRTLSPAGRLAGAAASPAADADLPTVAMGPRTIVDPPPFSPTPVRARPAASTTPSPSGEEEEAADLVPPAAGTTSDEDEERATREWWGDADGRRRGSRLLPALGAAAAIALVVAFAFAARDDGPAAGAERAVIAEAGSDGARSIAVEVERDGSVGLPDDHAPNVTDAAAASDAGVGAPGDSVPLPQPGPAPVDPGSDSPVPDPVIVPAASADVSLSASPGRPQRPAGSITTTSPAAARPPSATAARGGASGVTSAAIPSAPARSTAFEIRAVAVGGMHSCSVSRAGTLFCWGGNERGQLGTAGSRALTAAVVELPGSVSRVALGLLHSCTIGSDDVVVCWGANDRGQLGDGTRDARPASARVPGLADALQVAVGSGHSCALQRGGRVLCWGANDRGQLGIGHRADREAPSFVLGGHGFTALAAGWNHSCALQSDGAAYCWGEGGEGQLGDGDDRSRSRPVRVRGGHHFTSVAAGRAHSCGTISSGAVLCWGDNRSGQAGDPRSRQVHDPEAVSGVSDAVKVVAGSLHSCALTSRGEALCWGQNRYGQLGDGTTSDRASAAPVAGAPKFVDIAASAAHSCGVTRGGDVYCWGYNLEGQLGDGTRTNRARPVRVRASGA